jgi:hypothetical protein
MTIETEKLQSHLAGEQVKESLPKFWQRIRTAIASKQITIVKLLNIYQVLETAVQQIEAIVKVEPPAAPKK